jgi:hypothetical protein
VTVSDVCASPVDDLFKAPSCNLKCAINRRLNTTFFVDVHDDVLAWPRQLDSNVKCVPLPMSAVRPVHQNTAFENRIEWAEFLCLGLNEVFEPARSAHMPECSLDDH